VGFNKLLIAGTAIILVFSMTACTVKSIKKFFRETSVIEMTIEAAKDINPNRKERPSPVVVFIYELSDGAPFDSADFFAIYDNEADTIGSVLLGKVELELNPGETRVLERTLKAETRHLGVLVAYRDIDNAKWRASMIMPEHSKLELNLNVKRLSITLSEK